MPKRSVPWWQRFQIVAYVAAGLAAMGTLIVASSKYIELPQKVEAGEVRNEVQDKQIDRLITLQEYYQKQQQLTQPKGLREYDATQDVFWCCDLSNRDACFDQNAWYRCE